MKLAFEEHGYGIPLILIHAFPLSRTMWKPQIKEIVRHNCRLVLPDLRGFGESHNFADINTMEEMAKDVAELLEVLKIEKAIIGGLSMGGYVSLNFYRLFPEKFAGMILCDTTHTEDSEEKRNARFELIEKIEKNGVCELVEKVLPNLLSDYTKENKTALVAKLEAEFLKVNPQATIAALRGMAERKDHTSVLSKIDIPTLLIFGEDDKVTNVENAQVMNKGIQNSELKILKNCGHFSNLEQPDDFNQALFKFIKTVEI